MVESGSELIFVHDTLGSLRVEFFSVESLDSHFSEMLLNAEVSQFVIGDVLISIPIITEDVFGDIS